MYLKSLTLRGFKSFADKTELDFEPGITVVVGPNGSGKSNIVDALMWVLGSHSAKSLRGGAMSDVIFAGSPDKPGVGRAAVEITIDNTDGTLPIEFTEVTVSRSMFASGENSYAINGVECRLLDVTELLSDTGLGRENHTIVGQGQLDTVLNARPEDRRAFVEEAAGILKHRKRRERAVRKIAQMEQHVERLTDLVAELKRNLRPLERQAKAAAKHASLQAELQRVRAVRAVRELDGLDRALTDDAQSKRASDAHVAEAEGRLTAQQQAEAVIEQRLADLAPQVEAAAQTHFSLANLVERFRGLVDRIQERRRGLVEAVEEPVAGRDPDELRASASEQRAETAKLEQERSKLGTDHEHAQQATRTAEQARRAHEQAAAAEARRRAAAREQRLRWEGEIAALRSALAQGASEEGRMASQVRGLEDRRASLEDDERSAAEEHRNAQEHLPALTAQLREAEGRAEVSAERATTATEVERELERQRVTLHARAEALRNAVKDAQGGTKALMKAAESGQVDRVVGQLAEHIHVEEEYAQAVAAALGPLADAVLVSGAEGAVHGLSYLARSDAGRAALLPTAHPDVAPSADAERDKALSSLGAVQLAAHVKASDDVGAAIRRALHATYLVADLDTAADGVQRYPEVTFVTGSGQVAGPRGWFGGSQQASGSVISQAAADRTEQEVARVSDELQQAQQDLVNANEEAAAARQQVETAAAAVNEAKSRSKIANERLERLRRQLEAVRGEQETLGNQRTDLEREISQLRERLKDLEDSRAPSSDDRKADVGADVEAERLDDQLADAREAEVQARMAVSAADQNLTEQRRRITALEAEADQVAQQLAERERRRVMRQRAIGSCDELRSLAESALRRAEQSLAQAQTERDRLEEERGAQQTELGVVRAKTRELEAELTTLRDARHAEELRRTELVHARDAVVARITDDVKVDPGPLLAAARGAESPPEASDGESMWTDNPLEGTAERDEELADTEDRVARRLGLLGTVNPLALKEHAAMNERHAFMTEQLEDLNESRNDLFDVIKAVDERITEVFSTAFEDVAVQFTRIFPRLFPGGEGRLVLTDPDDMLNSGIDVEARPPGKRVKRLSLLSGGERSLTALAVLFAIFAARPSPFYVLDEVEAALDDINLQRFLEVVTDFRASSQLVIVTHQKRTMEIADTLYGVTMHGSGVSRVFSQKLEGRHSVTP